MIRQTYVDSNTGKRILVTGYTDVDIADLKKVIADLYWMDELVKKENVVIDGHMIIYGRDREELLDRIERAFKRIPVN